MHRGSRTLIPLTGVALVVFFLIGVALSGSEPSATAAPATVIAWYSAHAGQMKASGYLSSVGVLFGLVFFAYVRNYLSEAGGPRALATAAFGGAVVFAGGGLLGLGAGLALSADPGWLQRCRGSGPEPVAELHRRPGHQLRRRRPAACRRRGGLHQPPLPGMDTMAVHRGGCGVPDLGAEYRRPDGQCLDPGTEYYPVCPPGRERRRRARTRAGLVTVSNAGGYGGQMGADDFVAPEAGPVSSGIGRFRLWPTGVPRRLLTLADVVTALGLGAAMAPSRFGV